MSTFQSSTNPSTMYFYNTFYNPNCSSRGSGWCDWWRNSSFRRTRQNGGSAPPWRNGFVPRYTWREPAWADTNRVGGPMLPARHPDHSVWSFPTGNLTWTPHLNGHSHFPATVQWTPATLPAPPWPQTGDERPKFAPWLALNPFQPAMPMLQWDIRQNPITARLTTGAHISADLAHVLNSPATDIPISIIEIAIPACPMAHMWNVVRVQRTSAIKVQDILDAIYEWLQTPLTRAEMEHIEHVNPDSAEAVLWALQERASVSPTLHGWEYRQGPRRIDCLGDVRRWIGLSYSPTGQGMQLVLNLQTIQ
ncbi:hypothetical protein DEU56DRAFT_905651 [Suillus clintonianus]|uniref:uncharacterized protein n=1 Tax=Suillus clintonianus TaxID=1904413 RepID=UPI001B86797D|nr:uncharacterized protein DEU56DRAFT_905651 [Suillus clintonianus]KAG2156972.1 hypothetical protein DEU56DRAFT_905651 [Suillus clintonianus]